MGIAQICEQNKYIFADSMLPSVAQIGAAIDGLFVMEEQQDWADSYDKTLVTWLGNFHDHWNQLKAGYREKFYRM